MNEMIAYFENKKILIWGMGIEGKSSLKFLLNYCHPKSIAICDKTPFYEENIPFISEEEVYFETFDIVLKAPGIVSYDKTGPFETQASLFLKFFNKQTIGITGSKGKSTTSSLLYAILKQSGKDAYLVGNIGVACFDIINQIKKETLVVFELSCHQLEYAKESPHISVLLNLYEEHLDHYASYESYCNAKKNIVIHQTEKDYCIIPKNLKIQISSVVYRLHQDIDYQEKTLIGAHRQLFVEQLPLIGYHNACNIAVVYTIVCTLLGISETYFLKGLMQFKPLSHRLENCGTYHGVTYINDSIATIPAATIAALESILGVNIVLIGGMDRHISYQTLIDYLKRRPLKAIILMYETGVRIAQDLKQENVYLVKDLSEAVHMVKQIAVEKDVCLLSPAAASYGYFKNFEERGEAFKAMIKC